MQHHFDVELAQKYGMAEAVLINHFEYWLEHNRSNDVNFFDGRYWTYNSMKAFAEIFPYLSEKKIRNALKNLQDAGLIITGNFNKSAYDRTLWYAFSDLAESILPKRQMDFSKKANQNIQKGEPIPDNNTDNKPDNNTIDRDIDVFDKEKKSKDQKNKYGEFENVFLSDTEREKLDNQLGDICAEDYIEKMSAYIAQSGTKYKSHYAAILTWWRKDGKPVRRHAKIGIMPPDNRPRVTVDDIFGPEPPLIVYKKRK